jgi:Uma2 family endonuclease
VQDPIRVSTRTEPQPDLALLKPRADFYAGTPPTAADTLLVIEVADTTAAYDRQIKAPLYARHGVPELWIVDLEMEVVRFFRAPQGERYADVTATETPGPTPIAALPGIFVDLAGILG